MVLLRLIGFIFLFGAGHRWVDWTGLGEVGGGGRAGGELCTGVGGHAKQRTRQTHSRCIFMSPAADLWLLGTM